MLSMLMATAFAGSVYVNNTLVDPATMPNITFEKVTVRIDAQGNLWIDAPGYRIQVVGNQPAPMPVPVMTGGVAPQPGMPMPQPPSAGGVAQARWWMVTEDSGTTGHAIEVFINDQLAYQVTSGQPQKIVDVGRFLHLGSNRVRIRSNSANPTGGTYYVYIGTGSDKSGTVVMDNPTVQFGVSANKQGAYEREYTLVVDR
ncbi:MAG: hypothetical protein H6738_06365 [Alphaproteobacteria bacterium]|nr:hypothetical protein [Alphaproteobacteria bacterium]MCB9690177.1 hypothetical protein [Alphaproteobacteria bacterium]MCB9696387.1 hypothetical protein [Alphaproteobacteria bacterium]